MTISFLPKWLKVAIYTTFVALTIPEVYIFQEYLGSGPPANKTRGPGMYRGPLGSPATNSRWYFPTREFGQAQNVRIPCYQD